METDTEHAKHVWFCLSPCYATLGPRATQARGCSWDPPGALPRRPGASWKRPGAPFWAPKATTKWARKATLFQRRLFVVFCLIWGHFWSLFLVLVCFVSQWTKKGQHAFRLHRAQWIPWSGLQKSLPIGPELIKNCTPTPTGTKVKTKLVFGRFLMPKNLSNLPKIWSTMLSKKNIFPELPWREKNVNKSYAKSET